MSAREVVAYSVVANLIPAYFFSYSISLLIVTSLLVMSCHTIVAAVYELWEDSK